MSALAIVGGFVALVVVLGLVVWMVSMYNQIIRVEKEVDKAWSNIDVLLQQRSDELPKLIDTVEQYMDHEKETILETVRERYQEAESAGNPKEQAEADSMLQGALGDLFAVAEDYPELKANENFNQLQDRISSIEEQIADRREHYNQSATNYNTLIEQIPYVFFASLMNKTGRELYEADAGSTEDIDIDEAFGSDGSSESSDTGSTQGE
jgi:LemA protein